MSDKTTRDHIVEAADQLFYRQGYEHTSFSDIADAVQISRGNFYYHFKTKDEILDAVIDARLADTRKMLEQWDLEGKQPADRIRSFIHILIANRADISVTAARSARCAPSLRSSIMPRKPRRTSCLRCFGPGCAGNSRCSAARRTPTHWRCIFSPAARVSPRWRMPFTTRSSSGRKSSRCASG